MHALEITTFLDERISELTKDRLPEEPSYPSGQTQYASFMMPRDEAMNVNDSKSPDKWAAHSRANGSWDDPKARPDRPANSAKNASEAHQRDPAETYQNTVCKGSVSLTTRGLKSESGQRVKPGDTTLPPFLSPTLPPAFTIDEPALIPLPLSPTLPGAFQDADSTLPLDEVSGSLPQKRKRDISPLPPANPSADSSSMKLAHHSSSPSTTTATPKKSVSLNEYKKRKNTSSSSNGPVTPTLSKSQPSYVAESPRQPDKAGSQTAKARDDHLDAKLFAEKSQKYLARGTTLKREADKLSRNDHTAATVTATHAILYFISAFACDDLSRKMQGKLQLHENWKSTSDFILWVINLQKDNNEPELEGLCHQLHAICLQRLYENELRYLRSSYKTFEKQRLRDSKDSVQPDDQFWHVWTESTVHYSTIAKSWRAGQGKLSETVLRDKFPNTWKAREGWGADKVASDEGEFGSRYRLPVGNGSSIAEAVGFAQSVLKEFIGYKGINYASDI